MLAIKIFTIVDLDFNPNISHLTNWNKHINRLSIKKRINCINNNIKYLDHYYIIFMFIIYD